MPILFSDGTSQDSAAGGKVLQVVSAVKTDTMSSTATSFTDILTCSITPSSASSKVLCLGVTRMTSDNHCNIRLCRDSTAIFIGDADGSRTRTSTGEAYDLGNSYRSQDSSVVFLDSPSTTSATTYKLQGIGVGETWLINRIESDSNNTAYSRCPMSLTLMEIQ